METSFHGCESTARRRQTGTSCALATSSLAALQVYSAYRLARACTKRNAPLAIINVGATRADNDASLKIECLVGEVLSRLAAEPAMLVPPG